MSTKTHEEDGREAGFSLLELLVALTILGLTIATVGATIVRRDNSPTPLETARQMQSLIFRARSDAILAGTNTVFVIDTRHRRYAYPKGNEPVALPEEIDIRILTGGGFGNEDGETHVIFRPDGSSSGAEILVSDGSSGEARVNVNWLTGVPRLIEGEEQ